MWKKFFVDAKTKEKNAIERKPKKFYTMIEILMFPVLSD